MIKFIPKMIEVETQDKVHADCWDIITPRNKFDPMLVLNTYLEPVFTELYKSKQISREDLHNKGTGYVDAVGTNGIVERLQYYEYFVLKNNKKAEKYKKEITQRWECENITYKVKQGLEPKRNENTE